MKKEEMREITFDIINCEGEQKHYKFESINQFVAFIDSEDTDIPMLDDEIMNVKINDIEVNNSEIKILNDLYEILQEKLD